MKTSRLTLLAFALAAPLAALATQGPAPEGQPTPEELKRNVERWKTLPPAQREKIKQAFRNYRQFGPNQAAAIRENFARFRNLPPERRHELTKKWEGRSPQERERFAQALRQFQQQGADRRRMAIAFARMAKSLTPDQRRQLEQLQTPEEKRRYLGQVFRTEVLRKYLEGKSPQDRAAFEALSREEQKKQLQHFFREREMRGPPGERGGPK